MEGSQECSNSDVGCSDVPCGLRDEFLLPLLAGVPLGAFISVKRNLNHCISYLRPQNLFKHGRNVTPFRDTSQLSGELPPEELFAIHCQGNITDEVISTLVPTYAIKYVPFLRVLSPECAPCPAAVGTAPVPTQASAAPSGLRFIELFAGIGMFRLGATMCTTTSDAPVCVFASEISPVAKEVYKINFGDVPSGDITEIPSAMIPAHEVLTAGFPCQSFSSAGTEEGFESSKGQLFFEVCRLIKDKQPRAFLLENVANLVTMKHGTVFAAVRRALELCGYCVVHRVIDASVVVPQKRRRVYIVGFKSDSVVASGVDDSVVLTSGKTFMWPCFSGHRAFENVRATLEPNFNEALLLSESQFENVKDRRKAVAIALDGDSETLMGSYRASYQKYSQFVEISDAGGEGAARFRFLSVRECARLQGIPDSFVLDSDSFSSRCDDGDAAVASRKRQRDDNRAFPASAAYRLVGNAVCPLVAGPIFAAIQTAISAV